MPRSVVTLNALEYKSLASTRLASTLLVIRASPERAEKPDEPEMASSLNTPATLGSALISRSAAALEASSGTSPLNKTLRLKLVTLTWEPDATTPGILASPLTTIDLSSVCAPSVRRSDAANEPAITPPASTPKQPCSPTARMPQTATAASGRRNFNQLAL